MDKIYTLLLSRILEKKKLSLLFPLLIASGIVWKSIDSKGNSTLEIMKITSEFVFIMIACYCAVIILQQCFNFVIISWKWVGLWLNRRHATREEKRTLLDRQKNAILTMGDIEFRRLEKAAIQGWEYASWEYGDYAAMDSLFDLKIVKLMTILEIETIVPLKERDKREKYFKINDEIRNELVNEWFRRQDKLVKVHNDKIPEIIKNKDRYMNGLMQTHKFLGMKSAEDAFKRLTTKECVGKNPFVKENT